MMILLLTLDNFYSLNALIYEISGIKNIEIFNIWNDIPDKLLKIKQNGLYF